MFKHKTFTYNQIISHSPARPPRDQTYLWVGGERGACQQNRPVSEQLVAQLHQGKSEVVDQQAEKRLGVDWKNSVKENNHCRGEGSHLKQK